MKKSLVAISLIAGFSTLLNAVDFDTKISVGGASAKLDGETYNQYALGYTSNTRLDNGIMLGFGNSLAYGSLRSGVDVTTLDMDLRAGYEIIPDLRGYALGTGVLQTVDNDSASGLGYGAAVEYRITSNVAFEGSYKTTDMRDSGSDYSYDTSNIALKFNY